MKPTKVFFTKGVGRHKEKIGSFEKALREADIAKYNIVEVSSILPPKVKIIKPEEGIKDLLEGQIIYCVLSRNSTSKKEKITSSLGVAKPKKDRRGFIIEKSGKENINGQAKSIAEGLLEEEIEDSFEIIAEGKGKKGKWTTVVTASVFLE